MGINKLEQPITDASWTVGVIHGARLTGHTLGPPLGEKLLPGDT